MGDKIPLNHSTDGNFVSTNTVIGIIPVAIGINLAVIDVNLAVIDVNLAVIDVNLAVIGINLAVIGVNRGKIVSNISLTGFKKTFLQIIV